jgi:hypothetical protein
MVAGEEFEDARVSSRPPEGSKPCLCRGSVFVDESAEDVVALDRVRGGLAVLVAACR